MLHLIKLVINALHITIIIVQIFLLFVPF